MVPYRMILEQMREGTVVPFLGSDVVTTGRNGDHAWSGPKSDFLPRDEELARYLSEFGGAPSPNLPLSFVAHCFSNLHGRDKLDKTLRDIYAPTSRVPEPGKLHRLLTRFPNLLIVSLCRDHLLETAFKDAKRPFHRVAYRPGAPTVLVWRHDEELKQEIPNKLVMEIGSGTPVILQLYGTFFKTDEGHTIVTEADHVDFLASLPRPIPACFAETLKNHNRLLLGCRLGDWSLRTIFHQLWPRRRLDESKAADDENHTEPQRTIAGWAQHVRKLSPLEAELWTHVHKLSMLNVPLDEFVDKLEALESNGS